MVTPIVVAQAFFNLPSLPTPMKILLNNILQKTKMQRTSEEVKARPVEDKDWTSPKIGG